MAKSSITKFANDPQLRQHDISRKMLTAELGILLLGSRGVTLMTAAGENLTDTDDEMRVAFRQMATTFASSRRRA